MEYLFVIFKKTFPAFITSLKYSKVSTFLFYKSFFILSNLLFPEKNLWKILPKFMECLKHYWNEYHMGFQKIGF